jgi:hypothetical protein
MSKFEEKVIKKITERSKRGLKKYGVTMEREDLSLMDWLTHLQEELMDATIYVERLMKLCECPIHGTEKHTSTWGIVFVECPYCSRL